MYDVCACTAPTALTTSPTAANTCIPGKIAKMIFQRKAAANNFDGSGTTPTNAISASASWTGLASASDDTKIVISPYIEECVFNEPDILEDSENYDGAPIAIDSAPQLVTAMMRNISAAQYDALKDLQCERDLVVYMIDHNGNFFVREVSTDIHNGFIVSPFTYVMRDPARGGTKADQFKAMIQFYLPAGWYSLADKVVSAANFDPLTDLTAS